MEKFECVGFGDCCRNFRSKTPEERAAKFASADVLILVPETEDIGLPIFDWEAEEIKKLSAETKKYASLRPLWIVISHKKESVVVSWHLDHDTCPFLNDNKCMVYTNRPLVCRSFPVTDSGFIGAFRKENKINVKFSDKCRCWQNMTLNENMGDMKLNDMYRFFYNVFGDSYASMLKHDICTVFVMQILQDMANKGKIIPQHPNKQQAEKLLRKGHIGLVDFLKREGAITEEKLSEEFERIDNLVDNLLGKKP